MHTARVATLRSLPPAITCWGKNQFPNSQGPGMIAPFPFWILYSTYNVHHRFLRQDLSDIILHSDF